MVRLWPDQLFSIKSFLFVGIAVYLTGIFLDSLTTYHGLTVAGVSEANGFMAGLFSSFGVVEGLLIGKVGLTLVVVALFFIFRYTGRGFDYLRYFSWILIGIGIFKIIVGIYNWILIS